MRFQASSILQVAAAALCAIAAYAGSTNVTIDDISRGNATAALVYNGQWSYGPNCTECTDSSSVDRSKLLDASWHEIAIWPTLPGISASSLPSLSLTFNGTVCSIFIWGFAAGTHPGHVLGYLSLLHRPKQSLRLGS